MIARVDLDILVYKIGSACENKRWRYKGLEWEYKAELNKQLKADGVDNSAVTMTTNPEEWDKVKKTLIDSVNSIKQYVNCDAEYHISGKSNFRYKIATILPYKGNRSRYIKPYHYDNIRQFFVDVYDARISSGYEADDAIGLGHNPEEDIIVTIDKDLDCIPGLHYNFDKRECYFVHKIDADRHFFKQMLTGDSTDNILGLFGVGPKSKLVKDLQNMNSAEEMSDHVYRQYVRRFGEYAEEFFKETANLLWILQKRERPYKRGVT